MFYAWVYRKLVSITYGIFIIIARSNRKDLLKEYGFIAHSHLSMMDMFLWCIGFSEEESD